MSPYSWDPKNGVVSPTPEPACRPRLTVFCEYPDTPMPPTEVTFSLSSFYGIRTVSDAHGWFRRRMRENEQFEVATDEAWEAPLSFWSDSVRQVVVE